MARIPAIRKVFDDPAVDGALAGVLGDNYYMHPHRHCHYRAPHSEGQQIHKDSFTKRRQELVWHDGVTGRFRDGGNDVRLLESRNRFVFNRTVHFIERGEQFFGTVTEFGIHPASLVQKSVSFFEVLYFGSLENN